MDGGAGSDGTKTREVGLGGRRWRATDGNARKTIRNLEILDIRNDDNLILVKGAVPGAESGLVAVNKLQNKQG